ncbi:efflux RND transporter periplasmic adaptor subunit [Actinotalea fermentans]|uniref:Peptidoglycan binding-like domain-containing protein n=1 Tax=Actinotalea fermentans TaxID=43671 RepID=A0A511YZR5_9CELL|nr:hypothetical protein [Actinotalea fermentans]KGM16643.1 hypothetical protein N867_17705 [Actinotalea fermentans ATCC 43279 = JCM 9966 = DSM 3133]GEN80685.1 hypothetical protein AFE02nite_24190 [Actinotalea fermentans]
MRAVTGSTRTIWIIAITAVVSLGAGIGLSRLIVSPAEAAANAAPPEAGLITVPVEERPLTNDIVMRGDALYEDPVAVTLETGEIGGPAVVTGQVPEEASNIEAGNVILEVTGRPVILLTGELPVYRTLRAGVAGPDVQQLRAALAALGIDAGDVSNNAYDASAAAAVRALYAKVGYPAPTSGEEADGAVKAAQEAVRGAEEQVASAQRDLNAAGDPLARVRADGDVASAQATLDDAKAELAACQAKADPEVPCASAGVVSAQAALNTAIAERNAAYNPDTAAARAAVTAAQRGLTEARTALAEAQAETITPLPASEVVYLSSTPRRVDDVSVRRGSMVAGTSPVMTVSGATLQIQGTLDKNDADLIVEGTPVVITMPDGTEVPGEVQSVGAIEPGDSDGGAGGGAGGGDGGTAADPNRRKVVVVPGELSEEQRMMLQGSNVRITIPVSSTEGDVMAVPLAALSQGPGGESRVQVLDAGSDTPRLVVVETGLAAEGYAEIRPVEGDLKVGDRVVVGQGGSLADSTQDSSDEEGASDEEDAGDEPTGEATEDAEG